jgi:hypothetical protein
MTVQAPEAVTIAPARRKTRIHAVVAITGWCLLFVAGVLAVLLAHRWPFTRDQLAKALQAQSDSAVQMASFRQTYFPHPGCVAEQVVIAEAQNHGTAPLISIRRLTVEGSYPGLLFHRVSRIRAEGLHLTVPPPAQRNAGAAPLPMATPSATSGVTIGEIIADGSVVEFAVNERRKQPVVFEIANLSLHDVADNRPLLFEARVRNPKPPGDIQVKGSLGPWKSGDAGQSPISGNYTFEHADLGVFHGIAGTLSASGKFNGVLEHIDVEGTTHVPDFQVVKAAHPLDLGTQFHAVVNGRNGDVALDPVRAHFAKTNIVGEGDVVGASGQQGKTLSILLTSQAGRVQDLLRMFVRADPPPMSGPITFRARALLPPEQRPFLKKVRLEGDFGIVGAKYAGAHTQRSVDILSARARGQADKIEDDQEADKKNGTDKTDQDLEHVISNVKGHVVLQNAVANFTHLSFDVPGAAAQVDGTYDLLTEKIDMKGIVRLDTKLSKATTGVKSFLLKIVQPRTNQKNQGSLVSVRITGTYGHPSFVVMPTQK